MLAFIGFNLDNTCDISFGFTKITDIPVYLPLFASFVLGMLASVPFLVSFTVRKKKVRGGGGVKEAALEASPEAVPESSPAGLFPDRGGPHAAE